MPLPPVPSLLYSLLLDPNSALSLHQSIKNCEHFPNIILLSPLMRSSPDTASFWFYQAVNMGQGKPNWTQGLQRAPMWLLRTPTGGATLWGNRWEPCGIISFHWAETEWNVSRNTWGTNLERVRSGGDNTCRAVGTAVGYRKTGWIHCVDDVYPSKKGRKSCTWVERPVSALTNCVTWSKWLHIPCSFFLFPIGGSCCPSESRDRFKRRNRVSWYSHTLRPPSLSLRRF